ncbi:MAG: NERD domain-containing protein [Lachnospiraceae bacterium]|nr:NERD domain-containing protein [Lachnospiraceae bacterium]
MFSDESQEFDHIVVVGPQRIFNIETKNCSGKTLH